MSYFLKQFRLSAVLVVLCAILAGCEKECACLDPDNCTKCDGSCCDCCANSRNRHSVVVQGVLPGDYTVASYALAYTCAGCIDGTVEMRRFYGDNVTISTAYNALDLIMFNNDGETVLVSDDYIATTNLIFGNDTIHYQPDPFFSACQSDVTVVDVDTITLQLAQRVFDYTVTVDLINNDGRVASVTNLVVSGMADSLNLKTEELTATAAYSVDVENTDTGVYGTMTAFGPGQGRHYLTLCFTRETGVPDYHTVDITDQMLPLTHGGDIIVVIDVESDISPTPTIGGDGLGVELEDWSQSDTIQISI